MRQHLSFAGYGKAVGGYAKVKTGLGRWSGIAGGLAET